MTEAPKKPGRPRKATAQNATTPQESPSPESKSPARPEVPAEPEIDTQSLMFQGMLARHMIKDHRMTWGEVRVSMGYGLAGNDPAQDQLWHQVFRQAQA